MRSASASARIRSNADELAFVYEKNLKVLPTFACVLGYPGFWVRDLDTGIDWVQDRQRRAGLRRCTSRCAARHGDRPHAHPRGHRQGRGQGRADLYRAQGDRQGERRAARDRHADHVLPRRRRLRRPAAREPAAAPDPRARAGLRLRSADAAGDGADLSAVPPTSIRCMPIPTSPRRRAFRGRSCMGSATFGVAGHAMLKSVCGYDPARLTAMPGASRRRCFRARPSAPRCGATAPS